MEINPVAQQYINKIKEDCKEIKPLVAIHCITYNHEKFLRDALDGFVNQKTDFPFVAVVHEDKSTDGTAAIVREYAEKYPKIIKPIFEEENQYSKHDNTLNTIMMAAVKATGAKYIAYCEGDDYWTDPKKLQRQVEILESNPNCTMCAHKATIKYVDDEREDGVIGHNDRGPLLLGILHAGVKGCIPTASVVVRQSTLDSDYYKRITSMKKVAFGDLMIYIAAYHYGDILNIPEVMSVYRLHKEGASAGFHRNPGLHLQCMISLCKLAGPEYEYFLKNYKLNKSFGTELMRWDIFPHNIANAYRIFRYTPKTVLKHLLHSIPRFIKSGFKFAK